MFFNAHLGEIKWSEIWPLIIDCLHILADKILRKCITDPWSWCNSYHCLHIWHHKVHHCSHFIKFSFKIGKNIRYFPEFCTEHMLTICLLIKLLFIPTYCIDNGLDTCSYLLMVDFGSWQSVVSLINCLLMRSSFSFGLHWLYVCVLMLISDREAPGTSSSFSRMSAKSPNSKDDNALTKIINNKINYHGMTRMKLVSILIMWKSESDPIVDKVLM